MNISSFRQYIKTCLGAPVINIEIADEQMNIAINKAVSKFTSEHYDGSDEAVLYLTTTIGQAVYAMPTYTQEIIGIFNPRTLFPSIDEAVLLKPMIGAGSNPLSYDSLQMNFSEVETIRHLYKTLDSQFRSDVLYDFNTTTKKLHLNVAATKVEVLAIYAYISETDASVYYDNQWLRDYAVALCKLQWGQNIGKYSGTQLMGGVTLDYARIITEAREDIEKLEETLRLKHSEPPSPMIG